MPVYNVPMQALTIILLWWGWLLIGNLSGTFCQEVRNVTASSWQLFIDDYNYVAFGLQLPDKVRTSYPT